MISILLTHYGLVTIQEELAMHALWFCASFRNELKDILDIINIDSDRAQ